MSDRKRQIEEAARKLDDEHLQYLEEILNGKREQGTGWKYFERFVEANPPAPSEVDAWAKKHGIGSKEEFLAPSQDDERDAEEAVAREFNGLPEVHGKWEPFKRLFLAGRKGMVPAAEVERLKSERDLAKMGWNQAKENHAVEVERLKERIRKATGVLFAECQPDKGDLFAAVDDVLNPKEPRND